MKKLFYLLALFIGFSVSSQSFYTDFQDGSLEGWTNANGSDEGLSIQTIGTINYFQKHADGSNNPDGRLSMVNNDPDYWTGNYFYSVSGDELIHTVDDIFIKNPNDFDLKIRYGFTGANGLQVVTTNSITVPANSDWDNYSNPYYIDFELLTLDNLSIVSDISGMEWEEVMQQLRELFMEVEEFTIFHNETISYEGTIVEGELQIESIISYELLEIPTFDNKFTLYPNPARDTIKIYANSFIKSFTIYNTLGSRLKSGSLNTTEGSLDLSMLDAGVYLLELTFEDGTTTSKKLIKE